MKHLRFKIARFYYTQVINYYKEKCREKLSKATNRFSGRFKIKTTPETAHL